MNQSATSSLMLKLVLLLASSMTVMAGATIAPSLPEMLRAFSNSANAAFLVPLVLTVPALFIALCASAAGLAIDRWGRKKLLLISIGLYGLAGASGFFLDSLYAILMGRAVLGIAVAGIMTTCTTLIADYFIGEQRYQFMGIQAAFMSFGGVIFLTLGGFLAEISWRSPFLIYLFAFVILPLAAYAIIEPTKSSDRTNHPLSEETVKMPMKGVWLLYGIAFIGMAIFYMIPVRLPFLLSQLQLGSSKEAGIAIACTTLVSGITATQFQRVRARFNFSIITALIFLFMGVGYGVISVSNTYQQVLLGLIISGMGLGLLMPHLNVALVELVPVNLRGQAVGGLTTTLFLGQFLSPVLTQPLSQATSLSVSYGIVGGLMLVGALIFGWTGLRPTPKLP